MEVELLLIVVVVVERRRLILISFVGGGERGCRWDDFVCLIIRSIIVVLFVTGTIFRAKNYEEITWGEMSNYIKFVENWRKYKFAIISNIEERTDKDRLRTVTI